MRRSVLYYGKAKNKTKAKKTNTNTHAMVINTISNTIRRTNQRRSLVMYKINKSKELKILGAMLVSAAVFVVSRNGLSTTRIKIKGLAGRFRKIIPFMKKKKESKSWTSIIGSKFPMFILVVGLDILLGVLFAPVKKKEWWQIF